LNQQLSLLVELQNADSLLLLKKAELGKIPARVARTERILDSARAAEEDFKRRLEELNKKKRSREMDLEEAENRVRTLKNRMSEVKSNVEYQARLKEIDSARAGATKIEDEILAVMEQIEGMEVPKREVEEKLKEADREWRETKAVVQQEGKSLEEEIDRLMARRRELAAKIPKDLYHDYRHKMEGKHGLAVAEVRDQVCQGCNMNIPPQLYNEIRSTDSIFHCPECDRILYYKEEGE